MLYPGGPRVEKGFGVLVQAAERLEAAHSTKDRVIALQTNLNDADRSTTGPLLERLRRTTRSIVELSEGPLDKDAYARALLHTDVVLLPYVAAGYRSRTSGPFAEALAAGKPVVVTEGTWMSEQLAAGFGAGITFADGDPRDLARAIEESCTRLEELTERARASQDRWIHRHSPAAFVDCLLDAAARGG